MRTEPLPVRCYRLWLTLLLPRDFRIRFHAELLAVFVDVHAAALARGPVAPWVALAAELPGLLVIAWSGRVTRSAMPTDTHPLTVVQEQGVLTSLTQDLRYTLRSLRAAPGFSIVAILTLALGIGANTAIFSVVNGVLLKPLALHEPDRLVVIGEGMPNGGPTSYSSTSAANFFDWQQSAKSMRIAALIPLQGMLTGTGEPERAVGVGVVGRFFSVVAENPMIGRPFEPGEEDPATERVIILSHSWWTQRFGADASIIGSTLMLNGTPRRVVGIMPPRFRYPDATTQFWVPLRYAPEDRANRDQYSLQPIGRLAPGATIEQARAEMHVVQSRLRRDWPVFNANLQIVVYPLTESIVSGVRTQLLVLMGAVGFVLLVACANLGNLFLARATARRREIAVRQALGAGRRRLAQQFITESMVLALLGAAAGLALGHLFLKLILAAQATLNLPRSGDITLDWQVMSFTLAIGVAAGLFFGTFPVWQIGSSKFTEALRAGTRGASAHQGARGALVVSQLALAMVLLTGAGLLLKSLATLQRVDPGFVADKIITFDVTIPATNPQFFAVTLDRIQAVPGVRSVALISQLPITGRGNGAWFNRMDRVLPPGQRPMGEIYRTVTPNLFATIGQPVKRGRSFEPTDGPGNRAVVVNEALVAKYYPGEDPLGKKIYLGVPDNRVIDDATIVGVVGDTHDAGMALAALPTVYMTTSVNPTARSFAYVIRTSGDPLSVVDQARAAVKSVDASAPVRNVRTLDDVVSASFTPARFSTALLGVFALVALTISVVGVFGVVSFLVAQRTREFGIRLALGATPAEVRWLVVARAAGLVAVGIGLGVGASLALTRLMRGLLFGVAPNDPLTVGGVAIVLMAMAMLASYLPARRATNIDPTVALRMD